MRLAIYKEANKQAGTEDFDNDEIDDLYISTCTGEQVN